jgi:hypothetical protein
LLFALFEPERIAPSAQNFLYLRLSTVCRTRVKHNLLIYGSLRTVSAERQKVQEQIHAASFSVPEPRADCFRNCLGKNALKAPAGELLIDKARQPGLSAPEMTVLFGGLRVNYGGTDYGAFTAQSVPLSNAFFSNLMDMSAEWKSAKDEDLCEGIGHKTGKRRGIATAWTLRLAPTPSSVRSRKMTRSPVPRRCSCTISSPPGTR